VERTFSLSLVIGFPLVVSVVALLLGRFAQTTLGRERGKITIVYASLFGTSMPLFFLAQALYAVLLQPDVPSLVEQNAPWLSGEFATIERHLRLDALSGTLAAGVGLVSALVSVFGVTWAAERDDGHYFFAWVGGVEAAAMLMLLAESTVLFAVGWYALGVLAYLGVGWLRDPRSGALASRFLQIELLGSAALLVGLLLLASKVHSFDFELLRLSAVAGHDSLLRREGPLGGPLVETVALLFLIASAIRLGAFPLRAGIDATSRAPLPVLALLYGGVFAVGPVYLFVRLDPVISIAPTSMSIMVVVGVFSAVAGVLGALVGKSARGVLRHLVVSQHGLALIAVGMGAWPAAVLLVLAQGPAIAALCLACAAARRDTDGEITTLRVSPAVRRAALVAGASLAAIVPAGGLFALAALALAALVNLSAWTPGLNYLALAAVLACVGLGSAAAFRLLRRFEVDAEATQAEAAGIHLLALGPLAAAGLFAGALAVPQGVALSDLMATWLEPLTRISVGFGPANAEFRVGPGSEWMTDGGFSSGLPWALVVVTLSAGVLGMRWGSKRAFDAPLPSALRLLHRVAVAVAAAEVRAWAVVRRLLDFGGTVARLGVDEIAAERGSIVMGSTVAELGRRLRLVGRGRTGQAAVGIVFGVVFVLGWIYFKPTVSTVDPGLHGFGGLRPALQSPARAAKRRPLQQSSREAPKSSEDEAQGGGEL
jgi:NADH:ubiquinone oxidoreductase subunit 5 (subunit L)/multisubunit Na+/H+ antiporter MnhA subunit